MVQDSKTVNDKLFFNDKLREATEYFRVVPDKQDILEFRHEIRTTPSQNRTFIELPDSTPGLSIILAEVRYIPLSPKMIDNRTLAISYSLPKVWSPAPYSFGYMNVPCLLMMNPDSVCESRVIPLTGYGYDKFYYPHFSLFRYGDDVAIGCKRKTWPLELDKEDYCDKPEFNPFTDDFITDMRLTDTDVYLLIRYGQHGIADGLTDDYSVIRIGLDCDCAEEKSFAIPTEGTHFFGLRRTADGDVQPYMISNHEGDWKVTLYDFDN